MTGSAPCCLRVAAMRPSAAACASDQMPTSPWEMRPRASTAVASANTMPAPPSANFARCARCQSPTIPSSAEYMHIGEMTTRLRAVTPRKVMGVKSFAVMRKSFLIPNHLLRSREQRILPPPQLRLLIAVTPVVHLAMRDAEHRRGAVLRQVFGGDVIVNVQRYRADRHQQRPPEEQARGERVAIGGE